MKRTGEGDGTAESGRKKDLKTAALAVLVSPEVEPLAGGVWGGSHRPERKNCYLTGNLKNLTIMTATDKTNTTATRIDQDELKTKLGAAESKLARALAPKQPAGNTERRGSQTTIIKAGKVWCITSLLWKGENYCRDGEVILVKRPSATASPTAQELTRQKLLMVTEAALSTKFTKAITI